MAILNFNRANTTVLVIHSNATTLAQLRQALRVLGFTKISSCTTHMAGLERVETRSFQVVFLEACKTDMPVLEFVTKLLNMDDESALVAVTGQPKIDDVFGFLKAGGRGFLVSPFNTDTVEETLERAKAGPPISDAVLNSPDRNTAFAGVILNNLYRVAVLMRQVREFPNLQRDLSRVFKQFCESCELGKIFCDGGEAQLRENIIEACIARANVAATRLGRTRKKLKKKRVTGEDVEIDSDDDD